MSEAPSRTGVVVLAGGVSVEREVSLRTGAAVAESLRRSGLPVRMFDPPGSLAAADFRDGEVVVNALHGAYGEDGTVQTQLASASVRFTGSSAASSRLTFDKWATRQAVDVAVAEGALSADGWRTFPCVVKPRRGGSSFGLSLVRRAEDLAAALERAGEEPLIEAFVAGEEWTLACFGDRPMTPVRVRAAGDVFDTHAKYADPASRFEPLTDRGNARSAALREAAARVAAATGVAGLSRSDFIWDGRRPVFLETNTVPGLTRRSLAPISAAASGIDFDALVRRMLDAATTGGA